MKKQTSNCAACGLLITERKRKPCVVCGSLNRSIAVQAADTIGASDKTG